MAKNAQFLELGPANVYLYVLPKASLTTVGGNANSHVYVQAVLGGSAGNSITLTFVNPGTPNAALSVSVTGTAITVSLATNGGSAISSTANDVIAALTNSVTAALLVVAAKVAGEDGTGVVAALATTPLAGGSNTGTATDLGFMGEGLLYQVTTEAGNLTGAQTGNVPQDKVIIGGMVKIVIPFKEINLDNLTRGIPSARLVQNSDGSKRRIDFNVVVGASMRARALQLTINKIRGGAESALTQDIFTIPLCSPAEGEVNFPFSPTTQREIMTNWYAWPDPVTGRWVYIGDALP